MGSILQISREIGDDEHPRMVYIHLPIPSLVFLTLVSDRLRRARSDASDIRC